MVKYSSTTHQDRMTQSYILRIYPSTLGAEQTESLRCMLINSNTGEQHAFAGLTTLFHQLVEEVAQDKLANSATKLVQR